MARNWPHWRQQIQGHLGSNLLTETAMSLGEFAYANNGNRFLASAPLQAQRFAVAGVPFDGAVTNRPGARFGPQ